MVLLRAAPAQVQVGVSRLQRSVLCALDKELSRTLALTSSAPGVGRSSLRQGYCKEGRWCFSGGPCQAICMLGLCHPQHGTLSG